MAISIKPNKQLGLFSLVMINVIAIDNLRSLTIGATFGFSMVFFYLLAAVLFFIPTILVSAELATGWPSTGGVYVWVREAFGKRMGFLTIWLQWIYNVVWYPTIFAFVAGIAAYLINPSLIESKTFMLTAILSLYWFMTFLNLKGIRVSSLVSIVGAILGTIIPMLLIAFLGFYWLYQGNFSNVEISFNSLIPKFNSYGELAFFTNIVFGLMGIEMSAVHAGDVKNPKKNYPKALFISAGIILVSLIASCLAITIVIPKDKVNLVSGLIEAFKIFFAAYDLLWLVPVIAGLIVLGSLSSAATWILGSARGLLVASKDINLPELITKQNKNNVPQGILIVQGLLVTLISCVFFLMPNVASSYWILSNLTAMLALIFYILMFVAAIRLRYKYSKVERSFKIPGGNFGIWFVCLTGIFTCVAVIILGLVPPEQIYVGSTIKYDSLLILGIVTCILIPFAFGTKLSTKLKTT